MAHEFCVETCAQHPNELLHESDLKSVYLQFSAPVLDCDGCQLDLSAKSIGRLCLVMGLDYSTSTAPGSLTNVLLTVLHHRH